MIDILFLTYNRLAFTRESLSALVKTNWSLVSRLIVYDDGSTDLTREFAGRFIDRLAGFLPGLACEIRDTRLGNPVAIMNHYLGTPGPELFAKIDSDTVVPPRWLNSCLEVMAGDPELDLLGIEPPASRKPTGSHATESKLELAPGPLRAVPCHSIGGIGVMRRRCFENRPKMRPHATYGGFTTFQQENPAIKRGWIAPPLPVFLLDRLPHEPWASLSEEYIKRGWQRPWRNYPESDHALWDWWKPQCADSLQAAGAGKTDTVAGAAGVKRGMK